MDAWSRAENEVVVAEYVAMLEQELAGQSYVKTEANGRVRALTGRSRGSVEFKFQNVSGVLIDMHAPWVEGYKPAKNYQASLAEAVERHLSRHPEVMELMRQSIIRDAAKRIDVAWNVITPPAELAFPAARGVARPMHTDFVALEAANRSLGASGEVLILERERRRLAEAGRGDLAGKVEHVSVTQGDGLGYDIASFRPDGAPRLIEVKTTRRGAAWPMLVSRNEVAVSKDMADQYVLARVFSFAEPKVGLFELPGAIEDTCLLEPETWRALPKPGRVA